MRILNWVLAASLMALVACRGGDNNIDVTTGLQKDVPKQVQLGEATHTFTLLETTDEYAVIRIQSDPIIMNFPFNTPTEVDLNGEGGPEILVEVTKSGDGQVSVHITNIASSGEGHIDPPDMPPNP